jgi:hypothetical protein
MICPSATNQSTSAPTSLTNRCSSLLCYDHLHRHNHITSQSIRIAERVGNRLQECLLTRNARDKEISRLDWIRPALNRVASEPVTYQDTGSSASFPVQRASCCGCDTDSDTSDHATAGMIGMRCIDLSLFYLCYKSTLSLFLQLVS